MFIRLYSFGTSINTREQHFLTRLYKCRSDKECTCDTKVGTNRCFHSSRSGQQTDSHASCVRYSYTLTEEQEGREVAMVTDSKEENEIE